jgi:hypothetical protein
MSSRKNKARVYNLTGATVVQSSFRFVRNWIPSGIQRIEVTKRLQFFGLSLDLINVCYNTFMAANDRVSAKVH